jgi:predicted RNA-binding protein with PIN domain
MLYLVDGYNVTKADPATRGLSLEDQRLALVRRLGSRAGVLLGHGRVVVVFDGVGVHGVSARGGTPEVLFSSAGEKADDVIVRLATAERAGVTLVTDDVEIEERVRAHRGGRATKRLPRTAAFDDAVGASRRRRGGASLGGLGVPPGGNAITKELKDLWLTNDGE